MTDEESKTAYLCGLAIPKTSINDSLRCSIYDNPHSNAVFLYVPSVSNSQVMIDQKLIKGSSTGKSITGNLMRVSGIERSSLNGR